MAEIDRMLVANEEWARRFPGSKPVRPARAVAVVACMDSRHAAVRRCWASTSATPT